MVGMFILAKDISPMTLKRAIKLRLVRTYEVHANRGNNSIKSKEYIFHDEEGTYLHASIPREQVEKFQNVFKEGAMYGVKNFLVITNYFTYKTTEHRFMLKFNYSTIVKEYKPRNFPKVLFRLKSIEMLISQKDLNEKQLLDVIGKVVEIYSPLDKIIDGRPSRLIDFIIEDGLSNRLKCTVWDNHVDSILPYYNSVIEGPLIVLIQLCRAKEVNGEVRISSSYSATKMLFNHDLPEFNEFKKSLGGLQTPLRTISSISRLSSGNTIIDLQSGDIVVSTVADLYEKKEVGEYWVPAKIAGIESVGDWSYRSCVSSGCNKKLVLDEGLLCCTKCKRKCEEGILKYRLIVRVYDNSFDAPFLIWVGNVMICWV
ncbi:PREDICTED: replication factor A protein 1-like isoform X2 [Ipomoea nil]|uniref:replication factor A protein 1-like isoform X2 n=1 Tax=Ipomoea nil TaxID=35883 RepID=UPI000901221F|nr:PREDICTED: replication factor A protein 1-like isoform X2 [Ipomoea nil]